MVWQNGEKWGVGALESFAESDAFMNLLFVQSSGWVELVALSHKILFADTAAVRSSRLDEIMAHGNPLQDGLQGIKNKQPCRPVIFHHVT